MAAVPQFISRMENVVQFRPLVAEEPGEILEVELRKAQKRLLASTSVRFSFSLAVEGRTFLLEESADQPYAVPRLKRALECYVVRPIERLLASAQIKTGDMLVIDRHPSKESLVFFKDKDKAARLSLLPWPPEPKQAA